VRTVALGVGGLLMHNLLASTVESRSVPPKGFGSFALELIPKGSHVATFGGPILTAAAFSLEPPDVRRRSIQIERDSFLTGPLQREPGDTINHSCEPNCGMRNASQIVTMRDVLEGEELTYDYAMSDTADYDEFQCGCGTQSCRGTVSSNDWKLPDINAQYQGYFSPYIARKIVAEKQKRTLTKSDVEKLVSIYDSDPRYALQSALRKATGYTWESFDELIHRIEHVTELGLAQLQRGETDAFDWLLTLLNEQRTVES
jgi:uncharacterized protein